MRVFVAVELPGKIREALAALVGELKQEIPGPRWVRPQGIHLTLRFLGEVSQTDLERLSDQLARRVPQTPGPFTVSLEGLGVFPEKGRPRVLWVGLLEPGGALMKLQSIVEGAVEAAALPGMKKEDRPYRPHLTLARFAEGRPSPGLARALSAREGHGWGGFEVSSVCLVQSLLKPGGAEYRVLKEQRL